MSYFMFSTQIINRSYRSAVACAAYRSAEALYSERDGLTKHYKEREVMPETYILAPSHAPEWVKNRERLWNEVEKIEKQKNAQLAREIVMALPVQLTKEEQTDLTLDFCKENFSDQGMVADIAIHRDKEHNPHVHVMLTVRPFNEDGTWGNKRQRINGKSVHLTDWNNRATLMKWRKNFAEKINEKFKEKGLENRVSHESYEKQGIEKVAHFRLSREQYQYEQRAKKQAEKEGKEYEPVTYYGKLNKELHAINKELESLKTEKVVSLDQHQEEKKWNQSLDAIRKNASLNGEQKSALTMVAKRAKTYVDYTVARTIYNDIKEGNWRKKLDTQKTTILAEKNILNKAHYVYKENPNKVLQYGFHPKKYKQEMAKRISQLKELQGKYKEELVKYDVVLKKAKLALELQKNFTEQEFNHLYPERSNDYQVNEMYHAVQHFKETGELLSEGKIKSFTEQKEMQSTKHVSISDQTRNISKSIFILDRAIKKQSANRIHALKDKNLDAVYEASRKIESYQLQKDKFSFELEGNKELLRAHLSEFYSAKDLKPITHAETLIRLDNLLKERKGTADIQRDIKQLHIEHKQTEDKTPHLQNASQQMEKQYVSNVADALLQSLDEIQKANEEQKYKKEPKERKRRRHQKGMDHEW